jgi:hypothetical protein
LGWYKCIYHQRTSSCFWKIEIQRK